jgi:hypothetical protein
MKNKLYTFDLPSFSLGIFTALVLGIIVGIFWLAFGGQP